MNTITYITALEGIERKEGTVSVDKYERICNERKSIFEKLPDDVPIKLVMDFDLKPKHTTDDFELHDCTNELVTLAKQHITCELYKLGAIEPPKYAVKTANDIPSGILSFHLICLNYKMTKAEQKVFFTNVEKSIESDPANNWKRDYLDVIDKKRQFCDFSIYDRNRFLRSAYSTKQGEFRYFDIAEGTFTDTVISYDNQNATHITVPIPEKTVTKTVCKVSGIEAEEINAYLDAGLFSEKATDYDSWSKMGFAIYGACGANGFPLFDRFSQLCPLKYDRFECQEWYERLEPRNDGMGIGSIKYWAKLENPVEYERICKLFQKKPNMFISVNDVLDPFKCAEVIQNTLKNTLILCNEKWYMLDNRNLWMQQKEPSFYVINEIRKYLDYSNLRNTEKIAQTYGEEKDKLLKVSEEYLKCYRSISGSSYLSVVIKFLRAYLADNTFADKLDANLEEMAFENGIMNLKTGQFRNGIESADFITRTIPYKYVPCNMEKKAQLKSILLKILNNNPEHLDYFLSIIGYSFIGKANLEKSLYFCVDKTINGKGDNGKSFAFEILTELLPNYVYKSKSNFLEESNTKTHKQLACMKGMRLVWLDEFGKNKTNAELMKVIGDGTTYENEVMFGTTESLRILFKLFVLTNHLPNIDPNETAVYNRYKQISYASHFDRTGERKIEDPDNLLFIADVELKTRIINEYRDEVFGLIIEYAGLYYTRRIPPIPIQFINDTKDTQTSNDSFAQWVEDNMRVVPDGKVALKSIVYASGKSEEKVKDGMKRLGYKYDKELKGIGKDESTGKYFKGGYKGITIIFEEDET